MKISVEFERKSMLSLERYTRCLEILSGQTSPIVTMQNNYYYDDADFSLFNRNETLRVRQIGEALTLEYKHNKSRRGDVRICEEVAMSISVLPGNILLNSIETRMVGSLLTSRIDFLFDMIKVSLDQSIYLGIVDYELEIETDGDVNLPAFLSAMLDQNQIPLMGKYRRFISRLKVLDTTYEI